MPGRSSRPTAARTSTAEKVRAAMPCTPAMPLPATVTIAWPWTIASALTGYVRERAPRRDLGAGRVRDQERSHVHLDRACRRSGSARGGAGPSRRSARPRPPRDGAAAGSAARPAPGAGRRSGCRARPSRAPPGARSARGRAAWRRDRCRRGPCVVTLPSGAWPMKPGTTTMVPRGEQRPQDPARAPRGFGRVAAPRAVVPVGGDDVERVDVRRPPPARAERGRENLRRHPLAARDQQIAGPRRADGRAGRPPRTGRDTRGPPHPPPRAASAATRPGRHQRRAPPRGAGAGTPPPILLAVARGARPARAPRPRAAGR